MNDKELNKIEMVKGRLTVNRANLGKAGEYLVAGKLLLNGFNVYSGAIDDGIDLVAKKRRKFYYIQVKTAQDVGYDSGKYMAKVNLTTLSKFPQKQTFLVLVLHYLGPNASIDSMGDHNRYEQEYVVLPSEKLLEFFSKSDGHVVFYIYLSFLMDLGKDDSWIIKLKHGGREFILDEFLFDSFWQIEI